MVSKECELNNILTTKWYTMKVLPIQHWFNPMLSWYTCECMVSLMESKNLPNKYQNCDTSQLYIPDEYFKQRMFCIPELLFDQGHFKTY